MALVLDVKVIPQAGKQIFKRDKSGILKCYLKSAPEKGKANDELCLFISKLLTIPRATVTIIGGLTSRKKRVLIEKTLTMHDIYAAFGIEIQLTLKD
jgi:uncharacterized protein